MVGVITGSGPGLLGGSGQILGSVLDGTALNSKRDPVSARILDSLGQLGVSTQGRDGENIYVNAANGNLVIQRTDEMLFGVGAEDIIARTYNSIGDTVGSNLRADNWFESVQRQVTSLTGTINTAGSTITHIDWDGSQVLYTYATTGPNTGKYVAKDGAGAYDTLSLSGAVWTWTNGSTQARELYDNANGGRITDVIDTSGNDMHFSYGSNGLVSQVTTATSGHTEYTTLTYSGSNLIQVTTSYWDAASSSAKTLTRVRYGYDTSNRLSTVTVDLSPEDNAISDGKTYVTTYGYDGTSNRVASISQTDGSSLTIQYALVSSSYRVSQYTQTAASGDQRTTAFDYSVAGQTTVSDPSGQATVLKYDAKGELIEIDAPPASAGATAQTFQFTYSSKGDVWTIKDGPNDYLNSSYDANGDLVREYNWDGNTVDRTYDANYQLITETRYIVPDPDLSGSAQPSTPVTDRYVYDTSSRLVYTITSEGRVTQYNYNAVGQQTSVVSYTSNTYDVSGLSPSTALSKSTLDSWVGAITDKSTTQRTDTAYDFRGNVASITRYGKVLASGLGDTTATTEISSTTYVYDQAGQLLQVLTPGAANPQVLTYDGLGRVKTITDFSGLQTTIVFDDPNTKTTVTNNVNTFSQVSTYDKAGELISFIAANGGVTSATTTYKYDSDGRLRITTDALGFKTYYLYDAVGRKVADIQADGSIKEYQYNASNSLVATIQYATKLTYTQLTNLSATDSNGNLVYIYPGSSPPKAYLDAVRPAGAAGDDWTWNIFDKAQQLIETIDSSGAATTFAYDGASRLITSTAYANLIASTTVSGFKTTPPTTLQLPTASATTDRVQRFFYDGDGLLIGALDGEGYFTRTIYDGAGRKTQTIQYATVVPSADWASGTFATLLSDVTATTNPSDIHNWFLYDDRGFLMAEIDGEGDLTRYHRNALGQIDQYSRGQKLDPASLIATAPTLANLPAAGTGTYDAGAYTYDSLGNVLTETKTLAGGVSETTTYAYDAFHRQIGKTTNSASGAGGAGDARTTTWNYDAKGRLIGTLTGLGSAALAALGASPTTSQVNGVYAQYGTTYVYDTDDRVMSKTEADGVGGSGNRTLYYYDADSRLVYMVNALGETTGYGYDALGRRTSVTVYGNRVAAATLSGMTGGQLWSYVAPIFIDPTTGIANAVLDSVTHTDYTAIGTVADVVDPLGAVTSFTYNAFGERSTLVDARSVTTGLTYDRRGLLLNSTADVGGLALLTQHRYDSFGRENKLTDPAGALSQTVYDRAGRITSTIDALGQTTTLGYDARGNLTSTTDRSNRTTTLTYDAFERTVSVTHPGSITTTTQSNAYGQTVRITDAANVSTSYSYDADGNLLSVNDPIGALVQNTYDAADRLTTSTPAGASKSHYAYDAANRVLFVVDGAGDVTGTTYDTSGRIITTQRYVTVILISGLPTAMTASDVTNALASAASAASAAGATPTATDEVTHFVYDLDGRLRFMLDANNQPTEYVYDANGALIHKTEYSTAITPLNFTLATVQAAIVTAATDRVTRSVYDNAGRVAFQIDALGYVTGLVYDADGRVVKRTAYATAYATATDPSAATVQSGLVTSANDRVTRSVYDADGRIIYAVDAESYVTENRYDAEGRITAQIRFADRYTVADGATVASVGALAPAVLATSVALASLPTSAAVTTYGYDAAGRLTDLYDPLGVQTHYALDALGRVTDATVAYGTADAATTHTHYDSRGRILDQTKGYGASEASTTAYTYDGAGRVLTITDGDNSVTTNTYDAAGRLYTQTNPLSGVTTYTYDAFGNRVKVTDPRGNSGYFYYDALNRLTLQVDPEGYATATAYSIGDQAISITRYASRTTGTPKVTAPPALVLTAAADETTTITRDKLDRVTATTDAMGYTESYQLNAFGDRTQVTNKLGGVTTNSFDKRGQLLSETLPISAVKSDGTVQATSVTNKYSYDARGNLTQKTEAYGLIESRNTYYVYDKTDNLTQQYGDAVQISTINASTGAETFSTVRQTQNFIYDARGNVIEKNDSTGARTITYYDDLNRKVAQINPVGTLTTWTYDDNGNALSQFVYDTAIALPSNPHAAQPSPAAGSTARETDYTYDANNRLVSTTIKNLRVGAWNAATSSYVTSLVNVVTTNAYDANGKLVRQTDGAGASLYSYYDKLGRQIGQVDQNGYLTTYSLDQDGNVLTETRYATALTSGFSATTLPTQASNGNDRITTFTYDRNGRRLTETRLNVTYSTINAAGAKTDATGSAQIVYRYNGLGEVVSKREATGDTTTYIYDVQGRQTGLITPAYTDANGLITQQQTLTAYDGLNNVTRTTEMMVSAAQIYRLYDLAFGRAPTASELTSAIAQLNANQAAAQPSAENWAVNNTFGEPMNALEAIATSLSGEPAWSTDNATFITQIFQAAYHRAPTAQEVSTWSANIAAGWTRAGMVAYFSESLEHATRPTLVAAIQALTVTPAARVTVYNYNNAAGGTLASVTDASGFTRSFGYDAGGRVVRSSYTRLKSDGTSQLYEADLYSYDLLGRALTQAKGSTSTAPTAAGLYLAGQNAPTWAFGDVTQFQYDTFGEVTKKGLNGVWDEVSSYDSGGRLWRTTQGDGSYKLFAYDAAGNLTLSIGSITTDLSGYAALDNALALLNGGTALTTTLNSQTTIDSAAVAGIATTITVFDARGQATQTRQPFRETTAVGGSYTTIAQSSTYNAFGEVTSQTDARSATTNFVYNTLGKLVSAVSPQVSSTSETGVITTVNPTTNDFYDLSGRLIAVQDANGNLNTRTLLAGTGYGKTDASVTAEFHPDGGKKTFGYDVYGDLVTLTNELSAVETRTYDAMDRLVAVAHAQRTDGTQLTDHYTYDGLGQRLTHWNSQFGSSVVEATDLDLQGRIVRQSDFDGYATTYVYAWDGSIATTGLGTFGGWTKTTTNTAALTATDKLDYFGRTVGHTDFGGHAVNLTFNRAGWLVEQTNSVNQDLKYTYYNTGKIASTNDTTTGSPAYSSSALSSYSYDANGNRLTETYSGSKSSFNFRNHYYTVNTSYENSTTTYDALNRMISFQDAGRGGAHSATIAYEYDANSNVRHTNASYSKVTTTGAADTAASIDYWYKYDAMNRFVTTMGQLLDSSGAVTTTRGGSSVIGRGLSGTDITYDAAGQRVTTITTTRSTVYNSTFYAYYNYFYNYTSDGYLLAGQLRIDTYYGSTLTTGSTNNNISDTRDAAGRLTTHIDYTSGTPTRTDTYDNKSQITSETYVLGSSSTTTTFDYKALSGSTYTGAYQGGSLIHSKSVTTSSNSTTTSDTVNAYTWWDQALQSSITLKPDTINTNLSNFSYDANGHLATVSKSSNETQIDTLNYVTDASGQILSRIDTASDGTNTSAEYYYDFNGIRVGDISSITMSGLVDGSGNALYADFDQSYSPTTAASQGEVQAAQNYTVRDGDTLRSIASTLWGDSSLWYLIADANGLDGSETLAAGRLLSIPAKVTNVHNSSATFRVYDPNKAIGNVQPTQTLPPKASGGGCGIVGQILLVIVAVAVAVFTYGALTAAPWFLSATGLTAGTGIVGAVSSPILAGAIAGATSSIVSQGFGLVTGIQSSFDWKGVALSVIGGAVTGGVTQFLGAATSIPGQIVRGVIGDAVSQGVEVATGLRDSFDWTSVAVAGVISGVSGEFAQQLGKSGVHGFLNTEISGLAGAVAGAGARTLLDGTDFGDNIMRALPDVIGQTIGNLIAGGIEQQPTLPTAGDIAAQSAADRNNSGNNWAYSIDSSGDIHYLTNPDGSLIAVDDSVPGSDIAPVADANGNSTLVDPNCFAAGTLVHTRAGLRAIEDVRAGDWIAARHELNHDGAVGWRQVMETIQHPLVRVLHLHIAHSSGEQETVTTTPEHPFFVNGGEWRKAGELQQGDQFALKDGGSAHLVGATPGQGLHTVYNFAVEENHTYFVGERGIWVHNTSYVTSPADAKRANELINILNAKKGTILYDAKAAGVPATAVATAIAEEGRVNDFTSVVGHADTDNFIAPGISNEYSNQDILNFYNADKSTIENGTLQPRGLPGLILQHAGANLSTDPLTFDIGLGRINFGAAVDLFESTSPQLIHSLGLGNYNGNLQLIAGDLASPNLNTTIAFATLKISQVQDWYINNDNDKISAMYDAATPSQKDQLLDYGYRTSFDAANRYFTSTNYSAPPPVRPNAYNFFNDKVSPYSFIRKNF